ncbi:hypothetical protein B2J96_03460 [Mycobacterium shigaense]|nr:hypothetical protein B2J96_03460 [Mycobacterium shigaense]
MPGLLVIALQSCSIIRNFSEGVTHPMTPEESRAQVMDAARDIVTTLGLKVVTVYFSRDSCNDQGEAPFRGTVRIRYAHAPTLEASQAEVHQMVATLKQHGWEGPGDFHTHAPAVSGHGTTAVLDIYSPVQESQPAISVYGECRDMTTQHNSRPEQVWLDQSS